MQNLWIGSKTVLSVCDSTYDQKERNMPWHYQKNVENDIL